MRQKIVLLIVPVLILLLAFTACRSPGSVLPPETDEPATAQTVPEETAASAQTTAPSDAADEPAQIPEWEPTIPLIPIPETEPSEAGAQDQETQDQETLDQEPGETEAAASSEAEAEDSTQPYSYGDENETPRIPILTDETNSTF